LPWPIYVRVYVKEPEVWLENRRRQRAERREVRVPLFSIFKPAILGNTLTACWWFASAFIVGYSIGGLFPTYLQHDLHLSPALVALPIMLQSLGQFASGISWGWVADRIGRRWAMILPGLGGLPLVPLYLFTHDYTMIVVFFGLQGLFAAGGNLEPEPELSRRALPDRGARDGKRVLLSPGGHLGWSRRVGHHLSGDRLAPGVCDPDADRHDGRARELHRGAAVRPRNPRQGAGGGRRAGLSGRVAW
jgi:hypothetical protein